MSDFQGGEESDQQVRRGESVVLTVVGYFLMWGLHCVLLVLTLFVLVKVIPIFREYFDLRQIELPPPTQLAILWSVRAVQYWYLFFFLGITIDAVVILVLARFTPRRLRLATVYSQLLLFTALVLFVFLFVFIAIPIHALSEFDAAAVAVGQN